MINIAVLGHGVVGSGVCEVIASNHDSITRRAGQEVSVKRVLDLRDFTDCEYSDKFTKSFSDIINDDEISIVVEVMGGISPAYEYSVAAIKHGKSVVTSNKELVATKGAALLKLAKENNVNFFFEASVGGGIPIIRPMHLCLAANELDELAGILNGTTNFILTKMIKEKMGFDAALKLAQDLGYAERNPSADVDGEDACRKICILASLAFGRHVKPECVYTEGITKLTPEDVEYATSWGGVIKLLGRAARIKGSDKISCMVTPAFLSNDSQLAHIDDVYNGVLVRGNATGDVVFYGKGAGKLPTASAVIADVIDVAKSTGTSCSLIWDECDENIVVDYKTLETAFYVRIRGDFSNILQEAAIELFGNVDFVTRKNQPEGEVAFITPIINEEKAEKCFTELVLRDIAVLNRIRLVQY